MDHIAYERKKLERDVYLTAGRLLDYLSDGDDDYIDPYLGDAMYEDGDDDSDQDPSDFPYSFYNRHINEIQSFFFKKTLPFNLVFNAGFHYRGISLEDKRNKK
jgi:hypothetical protein